MPETFTSDAGRNACRRPCAPPSTLPAGHAVVGRRAGLPFAGGGAGNGECLKTTRLSIASISLSVPKPNVLISRLEDA